MPALVHEREERKQTIMGRSLRVLRGRGAVLYHAGTTVGLEDPAPRSGSGGMTPKRRDARMACVSGGQS